VFLVMLASFGLTGAAAAHTRSMSYSTWQLAPDGAHVELRLKLLELTRQPPGHPWSRVFPAELQLFSGATACRADEASRSRVAPEGWAVFRWRLHCESGEPRRIESALMRGVAASHTHFVRIDPPADDPSVGIRERVLVTDRDETWPLEAPEDGETAGALASSLRYIELGARHIATGWDHLAFVLALLLLAGTLREVAVLVSAFTIAHSVTLGLAALGTVRPQAAAVEVMIGFSIALVAAENSWLLAGRDRLLPAVLVMSLLAAAGASALGAGTLAAYAWIGLALFSACHFALLRRSSRPARLRAALAFAFGLVHGFGFAGVLMELELPATRLVPALFGFNLGVELGQLAVVAIAWPALALLERRSPEAYRRVAEAGSALIFALGTFWLVARNF
jgi:hypothetical protein